MFYYTKAALNKGLNLKDLLHSDEFQAFEKKLQQRLNGITIPVRTYRFVRKDGSFFFFNIWINPIYKEEKISGIRGIIADISEEADAKEALKIRIRYERELSVVSKTLLGDKDNAVDESLKALLKASHSDRTYIFKNFKNEKQELCMGQIYEACREGITPQIDNPSLQQVVYNDGFVRWKEKLSNKIPVMGHVASFPDTEKKLLQPQEILSLLVLPVWIGEKWYGFIGFDQVKNQREWMVEDVRLLQTAAEMIGSHLARKEVEKALKENEQKLRELNATKDKFFSIIGHDLKNPFANIIGLTEMVVKKGKPLSTEQYAYYYKLIYDTANMGFNLLENLLAWARAQSGRIKFNPENIDLNEIIRENLDLLKTAINNKKIHVDFRYRKKRAIYADKNMISTVIRNLISNAVKFTPDQGKISIQFMDHQDFIVVKIKDTGIGMNKEEIGKLFRIDVNFSRPGTQNERGTGLGLILCKEFVSRNKGQISVESQPGKGSTFILSLPKSH